MRQLVGPQQKADGGQSGSCDCGWAGSTAIEDAPAELACAGEAQEEDEDVEARLPRVVAEHDLRVDRGEEEQRHEARAEQEQDDVVGHEAAVR